MDTTRIDHILQYALIVAREQDEYYDRQLGPIHLIKYVYLADLAYSEFKNGETYTDINWQFYKYGPWSNDVYNRIEPALTEIYAIKKVISHPKYEDDFNKWSLQNEDQENEDLEKELADQLPFSVCIAIRNAVHQFGSDTPSLLEYVYLTKPMLLASPGEFLQFLPKEKYFSQTDSIEKISKTQKMTDTKDTKITDLKKRIHLKFQEKKDSKKLIIPDPPPRYDEIFQEGLNWLDSLEGEPLTETQTTACFSDDIWKSKARYDPDLS